MQTHVRVCVFTHRGSLGLSAGTSERGDTLSYTSYACVGYPTLCVCMICYPSQNSYAICILKFTGKKKIYFTYKISLGQILPSSFPTTISHKSYAIPIISVIKMNRFIAAF